MVYVDARMRGAVWRKHRLLVDSEGVSWGRTTTPYAAITAIAYWSTKSALTRGCEIRLDAGRKRTYIRFRARDAERFVVYERTVAALHEHVWRRIIAEMLAAVGAGEEVEVAGLRLSQRGLGVRKKQIPWAAVVAVRPHANPSATNGDLIVYASDERRGVKAVAAIFFSNPNGPLLPSLIRMCGQLYAAA